MMKIDLQDLFTLDFAYLETFTKRTETAWGSIFCNENQPDYYEQITYISVKIVKIQV